MQTYHKCCFGVYFEWHSANEDESVDFGEECTSEYTQDIRSPSLSAINLARQQEEQRGSSQVVEKNARQNENRIVGGRGTIQARLHSTLPEPIVHELCHLEERDERPHLTYISLLPCTPSLVSNMSIFFGISGGTATAPASLIVLNPASSINRDLMRSTGAFMGMPIRVNRFAGRRCARVASISRVCRPAAAVIARLILLLFPCRLFGER
jgi:hypothetical protein